MAQNLVGKFTYDRARNSDDTQEVMGAANNSIEKRRSYFWGLGEEYFFYSLDQFLYKSEML